MNNPSDNRIIAPFLRILALSGIGLTLLNMGWITLLAASDLMLLESGTYLRTMSMLAALAIVSAGLWLWKKHRLAVSLGVVQIAISLLILMMVAGAAPSGLFRFFY